MVEEIDHDRRRFFGAVAMTIAYGPVRRYPFCGSTIQQGEACKSAPDQTGNEQVVRPSEADRCRGSEDWLCRTGSERWSSGHTSARLALRHSQLCRCCPFARFDRLPGHRPLCARLWHDALSFE